ncbi:DNA adenine methylase [Xanthomonas arboricola]|uniref:site-specific DNA-methyltransferase (adenine-specific) n=1 Tax=Xanthomonas campestris pv. juglandis TaxID=195709 RepID=A0A8E4EVL8_XANCJ|nr:DNA adenine methylase [Xanthomonas arboricola]MEB2122829.1 DNA adenine methylase [Xanthomonas campestris pv. campestris]AKU49360.1 DNA methyltransferase [Xanthomonas arboricola pv. juglandis]KOA99356.1 DNA methyltransferase [Xanthomonas arboricola]KOB01155.1 DNA methyltransferase [Xanthomonas arboricola]KOB06593.1 DNA methyltransferase [Xanthomonas arboricola]
MTLRYIGSKTRLVEGLAPHIGRYSGRGRFVDAFCGMGSVAASASRLGWPVLLNDHLSYATIMSAARLTSLDQVPFAGLDGYACAVKKLNELDGRLGFVWSEYSPASLQHSRARIERRYFTEANAARIDSCRSQIFDWSKEGLLKPAEERLLLADMMSAANRVANIAGTYGCFLSRWTAQSQGAFVLRPRELAEVGTPVDVSVCDVMSVDVYPEDTVYLDPPYTKRQYASYYHLLETIVHGDAPIVEGVAGLRPWQHLASDFCYKRKALGALVALIEGIRAQRVLLSYSNEGHVDLGELTERLADLGAVAVEPLANIGRYRPNQKASAKASEVSEYLVIVEPKSMGSEKRKNATARK